MVRVRLDDGNSDVMGDRRSAEDNRLDWVLYDKDSVGDKARGDVVEKGWGLMAKMINSEWTRTGSVSSVMNDSISSSVMSCVE